MRIFSKQRHLLLKKRTQSILFVLLVSGLAANTSTASNVYNLKRVKSSKTVKKGKKKEIYSMNEAAKYYKISL